MEEGDNVWLKAYIARCDDEQALIGFVSMEGDYAVRVPLSELRLRPKKQRVARKVTKHA